jgi:hypothetical protein
MPRKTEQFGIVPQIEGGFGTTEEGLLIQQCSRRALGRSSLNLGSMHEKFHSGREW